MDALATASNHTAQCWQRLANDQIQSSIVAGSCCHGYLITTLNNTVTTIDALATASNNTGYK